MTLSTLLLYIYPDLDLIYGAEVHLINGTYQIVSWHDPRPQPTQAELDAVIIPAKRQKLEQDIDDLAATKIAGLFGKPPHSIELSVKQQNAQARVTELMELESVGSKRLAVLQEILISGGTLTSAEMTEKMGLLAGVLTSAELAEKTATQDAFTFIKSIRANGSSLKVSLATSDPDTFDINIGWPV